MKQVLYFQDEILNKLKEKAKRKGLSMSSYVKMILLEKWEKEEKGA